MNTLLEDSGVTQKFNQWAAGYGVIEHRPDTVTMAKAFLNNLTDADSSPTQALSILELLVAADHVCSAGMWLIAHMTYAHRVNTDGSPLKAEDYKLNAQGHTGGALNMAPAYSGYLLANALSGKTRAWLMGQGHCVAAIEALNAIMGNQYAQKAEKYSLSGDGLSRLCHDFYNYQLDSNGKPKSCIGSHVNAQTGGGICEGGYLGFAALQYVHMPLPGQELVCFLSDGAFEEQRGSDWAPRWWRNEDCGLVMPMMIANGRRIDQRSTLQQKGGADYLQQHLTLNGFDPFIIDGSDPAAYALAILQMAKNMTERAREIEQGKQSYPLKLPYAIAEVTKGHGLPAAGTNAAHNLPLGASLQNDEKARTAFAQATSKLFVSADKLSASVATLNNHHSSARVSEKDHFMCKIKPPDISLPADNWLNDSDASSPMSAIDNWFTDLMLANPQVRFRVGNPDEMQSNRMAKTLEHLKHRVAEPEEGVAESVTGGVITALNEEVVVCAALANKQGVGLVVSYEAFAIKMLGAMRQEAIFARHLKEAGRAPCWVSVAVIATSHTWENGKNEQSHQDPKFCENWLQEMSDVAPVYFPFDANTAIATIKSIYQSTGRIAAIVAAKKKLPVICSEADAHRAITQGLFLVSADSGSQIQLLAIGSYQLQACMQAAAKLRQEQVACSVIAILEPGRFREARDTVEAEVCHDNETLGKLIPASNCRVVVTHTGADIMTGVLRRLDLGAEKMRFIGYKNHGGTLDVKGMQFINGQSAGQIVHIAKELLGLQTSLAEAD